MTDWYRLSNDFHYRGLGEIRDRAENVVWRHRQLRDERHWLTASLPTWATSFFVRPVFVLLDAAGEEVLRIVQTERFPLRRFEMTAGGEGVGEIEERELVRDAYAVRLEGGATWEITKPLYSAGILVVSDAGTRLRTEMPLHNNWFVDRADTQDDVQLLAALAFVQSEHCRW